MTWYDANFGRNKAGLGSVGYREVNNVGGDAVARTTVGVVDAGDGMYGVDVVLNAATVSIQWDTGEAVAVFAVEAINQLANLDAKIDIIDANVDLILIDTTQLLLDVAAVNAQNVLILSDTNQILLDTTQLLLDVAAVNAQNVLILADTTQLLLDTLAIQAQNVLILADTAQILLDVATVDGVVDQILLDTTQLLVDTLAILADTGAILTQTTNIDLLLSDIEDGRDIREILRLVVASAMNILSGAESGSTQIRLRKLDGTGTRQLTNVDDDGNRLSIVSRDFGP